MWCYIDIKGAVNKTMPFKKKKKKVVKSITLGPNETMPIKLLMVHRL